MEIIINYTFISYPMWYILSCSITYHCSLTYLGLLGSQPEIKDP